MKKANVAFFVPNLGCPHMCSFCDQTEITSGAMVPTPAEIRETSSKALVRLGKKAGISEIAFFGGSFTCIDKDLMESLLCAASEFVGPSGFRGIRISTRPDAIDDEILSILKRYGVSSIELGAQSMSDKVLLKNMRGHTSADVVRASALIKDGGFELGLQMMTGLYGSSDALDIETAEKLASLGPETIRIYPTIVLEGTRLARLFRSGEYDPPDIAQSVALCERLLTFFEDRGVRVIRLGLHASDGIKENYVAGPWHPAFRELCEGRVYLDKARAALSGVHGGKTVVSVRPGGISKFVGQHRCNIGKLEKMTGTKIRVREDPALSGYDVKVLTV